MIEYTEGLPRCFVPICVRTPIGFIGGPSGYQEVSKAEADQGLIKVEVFTLDQGEWVKMHKDQPAG